MPPDSVVTNLHHFTQMVEAALEKGQSVNLDLRLGSYDVPGEDGYLRPRLDGSAVLTAVIGPLPPGQHR